MRGPRDPKHDYYSAFVFVRFVLFFFGPQSTDWTGNRRAGGLPGRSHDRGPVASAPAAAFLPFFPFLAITLQGGCRIQL